MVGADISESEILADAVPGIGSRHSTQERDQSKRSRSAAVSCDAGATQKAHWKGKASYLVDGTKVVRR